MFNFLAPQKKAPVVEDHQAILFKKDKWLSLIGVFIGYAAFYIVRNNFTLSTPQLKDALNLSKGQIGLLSSCLLISYGLGKGVMSAWADKTSPKRFMALGLTMCALLSMCLAFFWSQLFCGSRDFNIVGPFPRNRCRSCFHHPLNLV